MDLWFSTLLSLVLAAVAVVLMVGHVRAWRASAVGAPLEPAELDFRRRRYRRRMQTSGMLGLLAAGVFVGYWIAYPAVPAWGVLTYWGVVVLVVAWLALLALADVAATWAHYSRVGHRARLEQIKLEVKARHLQQSRGNGQPDGESTAR